MEGIPALGYNRKRRLPVQNRFKGCLRSHTYPQRLPTFSSFGKSRYCLQLCISSFRFELGTKDFHQTNALRRRTTSRPRNTFDILPRRPLHLREIEDQDDGNDKSGDQTPPGAWVPN
ncbi:hypothetical protein G6F68_019398 [Rhizopus microsporus]|nr:hypothetical protein G6F68_019398 [Rhizopus microsporus]